MKKGDIKLLETLCYFVPLVSTLLLIFFDLTENSNNAWIACGFIILGSLISSKNYLSKK